MNNHAQIHFDGYPVTTPQYDFAEDERRYFRAVETVATTEYINVFVALYDEEREELQKTLESIANMAAHVRRKVHVLIVQDGWCRAKTSLKQYFRNMLFPNCADKWNYLDDIPPDVSRTFVIQPVDEYTGELDYTWVSSSHYLPLSILIKTDNRMKHNSHAWFLRSFCREYPSIYVFMTDTGSTHDMFCLARMEQYMDKNTGVAGCHGYPWIAPPHPHASWVERYLRRMQEYELGPLAVDHDRGFQSMFGFQQTLSGPCTFLRTVDATYPSLLVFMSQVFDRDPRDLSILSSNLNIVEDTAMTLYMFASSGKLMSLVPDAYYYYDVETQPSRFITQRRRWMNGVGSGLIIFWKTYHKILQRSFHTRRMQYFVRALLAIGICMQVIFPFFQPALFAYATFQAFNPNFCSAYPHVLRSFQETILRPYFPWLPTGMLLFYLTWYSVWVLYHAKTERGYSAASFWSTFIYCHTCCVYSYYAVLTVTLQVVYNLLPLWQKVIVAFLISSHYASPMIISVLKRDARTFSTSTVGLVPYLAFFPMWSFLYGYNIGRIWDVSWGNRIGTSDVQLQKSKYHSQSLRYTYAYLVAMSMFTCAICYSSINYDASMLHAIYVVPWYALSSVMGVTSIVWTCKYLYYKGTEIFGQRKFNRLQRMFTFGKDRATYIFN